PPTAPIAALGLKRLRRIPYVYLIHDLYPDLAIALGMLPRQGLAALALARMQGAWLRGAERVVVIGRCMRDHISATYRLPVERSEVIPNWADAEAIVPLPKETRFRAAHALGGPVVLYAGNFGQYQDFENILEAARRLQQAGSEITFVMVGEGAKKEQVAA